MILLLDNSACCSRRIPAIEILRFVSPSKVPARQRDNFLERQAGTDGCSRVEQSSAQYRKFADECRRLVRFVRTADERKVLQEMEAAWTKVAEEVEGKAGKNGI
jgi:hypothetical protein